MKRACVCVVIGGSTDQNEGSKTPVENSKPVPGSSLATATEKALDPNRNETASQPNDSKTRGTCGVPLFLCLCCQFIAHADRSCVSRAIIYVCLYAVCCLVSMLHCFDPVYL